MRRPGATAAGVRRPAAMLVLVLSGAGCHRRSQVVVAAPPPPAAAAPAGVRTGDGRAGGGEAGGVRPRAVAPPSTRGRPDVVEVGLASWYGPPYHNRKGADGTVYDQNALTAAHKTLPLGSMARVTNLSNNQAVEVRITDRGPFVGERIIDLSLAAAKATGVYRAGVAKVRVEAYVPAPRAGADPGGRWCVQIGAFLTAEDAVVLKNELLRRYEAAKVIEFPGPTGYWVRINPKLPSRAAAERVAGAIHVPDAAAYVVRTD